jgi:hypothetical protein
MWSVDVLRAWIERLCRGTGDTAEILAALGLAAAPWGDEEVLTVDPPPPGTEQVVVNVLHGTVHRLTVRSPLTLGQLRGRFDLTEVPAFYDLRDAYAGARCEFPGAAYACELTAFFSRSELTPESVPRAVVVQRHPARPTSGVTVDDVRAWAAAFGAGVEEALTMLGIAGRAEPTGERSLPPYTERFYRVRPTPPGVRSMELTDDGVGLCVVDVDLLDSTLTRAALDTAFGTPQELPPAPHVFHEVVVCYQVGSGHPLVAHFTDDITVRLVLRKAYE